MQSYRALANVLTRKQCVPVNAFLLKGRHRHLHTNVSSLQTSDFSDDKVRSIWEKHAKDVAENHIVAIDNVETIDDLTYLMSWSSILNYLAKKRKRISLL